MDILSIKPSKLRGETIIPPSKSQTLRAILFASLCKGTSRIKGLLPSPDTDSMVQACSLIGARIQGNYEETQIEGLGGKVAASEDVINAGNSGIVLRFMTAAAALSHYPIVITGDRSIRHQRPMLPLLEALAQAGARAISTKKDGFAPIIVHGPYQGGNITVCGKDSQMVSALLIASPFAQQDSVIQVTDPGEIPWVSLTLSWLDRLGIQYENQFHRRFTIPGRQMPEGFQYQVAGDLSTLAFPLCAALITQSEITLHNVDLSDAQGDKKIVDLLRGMGADLQYEAPAKKLYVKASAALKGGTIDVNDCIDALPILTAMACYCQGETRLVNASVAKTKESNRLASLPAELRKMGADIQELRDGLLIIPKPLEGKKVYSHHDHRVALSLAAAALGAKGETSIEYAGCIAKTYSSFVQDFRNLGADIR